MPWLLIIYLNHSGKKDKVSVPPWMLKATLLLLEFTGNTIIDVIDTSTLN